MPGGSQGFAPYAELCLDVPARQVAALVDNDAHMTMLEGSAYELDTKPHGHGDVHTLLASTGIAAKWDSEGA